MTVDMLMSSLVMRGKKQLKSAILGLLLDSFVVLKKKRNMFPQKITRGKIQYIMKLGGQILFGISCCINLHH